MKDREREKKKKVVVGWWEYIKIFSSTHSQKNGSNLLE
jgi:hypothetical protein